MRTPTIANTTGGMVITYDRPYGPQAATGAIPIATAPPSMVTVGPAYGATGAAKLTTAGIVAMTAAVNTYVAALSAADSASINNQYAGGLAITIAPMCVKVPAVATGVAALVAALAAVLAVGANVQVIAA